MKNNKLIILALAIILTLNVVFAAGQELNFTRESEEGSSQSSKTSQPNLRITSLRQDPFPANPGEYVDLYLKIENTGGQIKGPVLEVIAPYPFSVYPTTDQRKVLPTIEPGEKLTLKYRLKVDENAIPGEYEVQLRAQVEGNEVYYPYYFNMNVDDVTTSFDVALQDITKEGASIAISNTGKNAANSITVRLDNQDGFDLYGPSSYIIGNLNNGDYTILNVLAAPKEGQTQPKLKLQIDYTDIIGNRRTVEKEIPLQLNKQIEKGFSDLVNTVSNGGIEQQQGASGFMYVSLILLVIIVLFFIYHKKKIKKHRHAEE